jgi:hypothetical protein
LLVVALTSVTGRLAAGAGGPQPPGASDGVFPAAGASQQVRIAAGESLRLSWSDAGAHAFLIGVGPVPPQGEHVVTPQADVTYTLIAGDGPGVRFRSVDVTVQGRKGRGVGNPDFPTLAEYRTTIDAVLAGGEYPALVHRVYRYLQDVCGHEVESTHKPWETDYTLWTNYSAAQIGALAPCLDRAQGLDVSTRPVGAAFYVRLTPAAKPGAGATAEIGAIARFRYASEKRWRSLDDPAYAKAFADGLRKRLEALK